MTVRWSRLRYVSVAATALLAASIAPAAASAGGSGGRPPGSAAAGSSAGWHIAGVYPGFSTLYSVTSIGRGDAWLAGQSSSSDLFVQHWTGRKWRTVPTPPGVTSAGAVIAGSSPGNVWAFTSLGTSATADVALRWNGDKWKSYPIQLFGLSSAVVFGSKDAWVFATGCCQVPATPVALRFNGTKWSPAKTPIVVDDASALSASNIWAVGPTVTSVKTAHWVFTTEQWTGGAWRAHALPRLRLPKGTALLNGQVLALGPKNVWADFSLQEGQGAAAGTVLVHYNGRKWTQVTVPYKAAFMLTSMTADGQGGIWIAATQSFGATQYMYHLRAGRWSRMEMPSVKGDGTQVLGAALQAGTTSVWAVGDMVPNEGGTEQGVLLRYNP
jgi:hypothetical protein